MEGGREVLLWYVRRFSREPGVQVTQRDIAILQHGVAEAEAVAHGDVHAGPRIDSAVGDHLISFNANGIRQPVVERVLEHVVPQQQGIGITDYGGIQVLGEVMTVLIW